MEIKLRRVKLPKDGIKVKLRGIYGVWVDTKVVQLRPDQQIKIISAIEFIHSNLDESRGWELPKEIFLNIAQSVGILRVKTKQAGAYASSDPDLPVIWLGDFSFIWNDPVELAVTLLHELLHVALHRMGEDSGNRDIMSREEAEHDLRCYESLGLPIRACHWALKKFPELAPPRP
jgi:hypothetical protein